MGRCLQGSTRRTSVTSEFESDYLKSSVILLQSNQVLQLLLQLKISSPWITDSLFDNKHSLSLYKKAANHNIDHHKFPLTLTLSSTIVPIFPATQSEIRTPAIY